MRRFASAVSFVLPSAIAVGAAAVAAGVVEGVAYTSDGAGSGLLTAAAAGFAAWYTVPIGVVLSLAVRALWRSWRPDQLADALTEPSGSAPRLAAWLTFLLVAVCTLSAMTFNAVKWTHALSPVSVVVGLVTALVAVATTILAIVVSRPAVDLLAALFRMAARGTASLRPRVVVTTACVAIALAATLGWWVSIRPRIGHLELGVMAYAAVYIGVVLGSHAVLSLRPAQRFATVAGAGVGVLVVAVVASSLYVRHMRPFVMLDLWGSVPVGGLAIDLSYDLEDIRSDLRLSEIAPEERAGAAHPDIVLITIDTVRADMTPPYGGKSRMPGMNVLARKSTVFDWAFSPGNVTRRSLPTLAAGVNARRMRGRVAGWALRLDPRHVLLAERLRAAGYDTAGFFCCRSFFAREHRLGLVRGIERVVVERDDATLAELARDYLQEVELERVQTGERRPVFVWMHLIEPHGWEKKYPARTHGHKYPRRYQKSLEATDKALMPLLTHLQAEDRLSSTLVVLTSDHGEGLGDHGVRKHASGLYNTQIHVPLLIAGPGVAAKRLQRPVGLVDLAPTILDLAGYLAPGMPDMDGRSLAPLVRGEAEDAPETGVVFSDQVKDRSVGDDMRAVISGKYKLIVQSGKPALLFDVVEDPKETANLAADNPDVVARLQDLLNQRPEGAPF